MATFLLMTQAQANDVQLELRRILTCPLTVVPSSTGTTDVFLATNDKSKGVAHLLKEVADADEPPQ